MTAPAVVVRAEWPRLTIEHNHGVDVISDARVVREYQYDQSRIGGAKFTGTVVEGTVVSGYSTSRLFSATSTSHLKPGAVAQYDLYGKRARIWERAPGDFVVNMQTCG